MNPRAAEPVELAAAAPRGEMLGVAGTVFAMVELENGSGSATAGRNTAARLS